MFAVACQMLWHGKTRTLSTIIGVAVAFFLSAAQLGLLVGWCNTISAIILHADADVWVMAQQTPAFDYGTGIPRQRIYQVRTVPGVAWAQGMFMGWNYWQRPDGRRTNIELVGLDDDCVGGPWNMHEGGVEVVQLPDTVIIDELFVEALGVERLGDEVEIFGTRARVGGISRGIRTITAAPFIFTSLETAQKYDHRSSTDDVTYVLIRCQPGVSPATVRDDIMRHVPAVEALTSLEFALRSIRYWMLETGLGITVVLTATLGVAVGAVIISQTLFAITNDYLREYATLLAVGFSRWQLVRIVFSQATVIGLLGIGCGSIAFSYAIHATSRTPIPLETTPWVFLGICVLTLACCLLASVLSIRSILRVDPITVFHS